MSKNGGNITLFGATAMGVGGMIGAGIFSILGVIGAISGSAAWISFLGAGVLALLCGHSFARLGATFPSSGGPVEFLLRGLGTNLLSGSLNVMLWLSYVLALSLYASAFAGYAAALTGGGGWVKPAVSVGVVAGFLFLNVVGPGAVGKAEGFIVVVKLLILLGFVAVTAFSVRPSLLGTAHWAGPAQIAFGLGTAFLAYEGFGLITNAAGNMADPQKTLPRAIYLSIAVAIAVYVLVVLVTFGNLPVAQIVAKQEYALAAAARPALGQIGFTVMAVAALFSTASAINATLFGGANVSFQVAHDRQMPAAFDRTVWHGAKWGLFVTAGLVAVLAATVPLASIANTGSAAFLVIYSGVCVAHLRLRKQAGGAAWIIWAALLGCAAVFVLLMIYLSRQDRGSLAGFAALVLASVVAEALYRRVTGRTAPPAA